MPDAFPLDPSARLVSEAISQLGWKVDPKAVAERVRQLQRGLPAEDEFALLVSWLGKCTLVHGLDQAQAPPNSKGSYRVPDLVAVFRYKDRELPVLIEVKTSVDNQLSWRPDLYDSLLSYAKRLELPLLLAWKWTRLGFWTLSDISVFSRPQTNYHLSFETAMKHSLMCELAGDFTYVFQPGVGMHLKFDKIQKLASDDSPADRWRWEVRVSEAYFTDAGGAHLDTLGPGVWYLFMGADQETETDERAECFDQRFVMTEESPMQAVHRLLPLVAMGIGATEPVPWRELLERHSFPIGGEALAEEARAAIGRNIIRYVFHQVPAEVPPFLG